MKHLARTILGGILSGILIAQGMLLTGCNEDQIIAGIKTAADVATQAANVLRPVNPTAAALLTRVAKDLGDLDNAYLAYDKAAAANKPGAIGTIESLVATLQAELSTILADVGVKNPGLVETITIAVAVVNSAILTLAGKVAGQSKPLVQAQAATNAQQLPIIPGAKSAKDLANAWNLAVGKDFQVKAH